MTKVSEKCIFQSLNNDTKSVLSIKESYSIKKGPKFSQLLMVRLGGGPPPPLLTVSLTVKNPFWFLTTSLSIVVEAWVVERIKWSVEIIDFRFRVILRTIPKSLQLLPEGPLVVNIGVVEIED